MRCVPLPHLSRVLVPLAALLLVTPVAVADSATSTASPRVGVRTSARGEVAPAAARGVLAWSQNSRRHPGHYNVYVKRAGHKPFRVNPRGTEAFTGHFDGSTLVYAQTGKRGNTDIRFLNVATGRRSAPARVNTRRSFEGQASKDNGWLLFARSRRSSQRIILRNMATGSQRLLATGNGGRRWAQTGELRGRYATYVKCRSFSFCNVFRYNIATHGVRKVPNPRRRALYAASVTANGTVYYAIGSRINCPRDARLWKLTPGGRKVKLATLGPRFDTGSTSAVVRRDGSVDVFFDAYRAGRRCALGTANIYKVTVR